jgi:serine/threonine-protein kinase RIO1
MNFILGDCIGKGASATVYRALGESGQVVAVKQFTAPSFDEKTRIQVLDN